MTNTDGERLATVTYLPGVRPAGDHVSSSPSVPEPEPERRLPTFQDFDRSTNGTAASTAHPTHPAGSARERAPRAERDDRKRDFDRISNVSMHALARRGMSSSEMRDYLVGREFDADEVEIEIDRLEQVGLLDDVALGETLVRTLRERKGLGRSALNAELRRRKLDPDAIGASLETLEDDELDRALALAVKRAPQLRVHDRDTAKRRLVAFLMRKGYSGSTSASAADRVLTGGYGADEHARTGPAFR
jgi:SOS response regulatory protein OraA/RecX